MDTTNIKKEAVEMNSTESKAIVEQSAESKVIDIMGTQEDVARLDESETQTPAITEVQDMSVLIPQEYRSIEDTPEEIQAMTEQGLFSPSYGMAHILNRLDGKLYAHIVVDKNGNRTIGFCQQYEDGNYSPEFSIKQEDLLMVVANANTSDKFYAREANASKKRIMRAYLSKCDGQETLNIGDIMQVLVEVLNQLPRVSESTEMSKQELYGKVVETLKRFSDCFQCGRRKGYIILSDNDIENVANEVRIPSKQLLARLKRERLLYLTDSCKGYQAKVPIGLDREGKVVYDWGYCLFDLEYFARRKNPEKYGPAEELETPLRPLFEL